MFTALFFHCAMHRFRTTHFSVLTLQTSSMRTLLSARDANWTHFSTTFDANLCCESNKTFPFTAFTIWALSSWVGEKEAGGGSEKR